MGGSDSPVPPPPPHHQVTHPPLLVLPFPSISLLPTFSYHCSLHLSTLYTTPQPAMQHSFHTPVHTPYFLCFLASLPTLYPSSSWFPVLITSTLCSINSVRFFLSHFLYFIHVLTFPGPSINFLHLALSFYFLLCTSFPPETYIYLHFISSGFRCNIYLHKALY